LDEGGAGVGGIEQGWSGLFFTLLLCPGDGKLFSQLFMRWS